jgi:hypothetical protein
MNIQYVEPLSRGVGRMKRALFHPFDLKKWFVVGFTAFLAGLTDCSGHGGTGQRGRGNITWEEILYFPQKAWEWLGNNPTWAVLIAIAAVLILVLAILVTWWSSRGKFMFLDNVVHDRAMVVAPWNEYRTEGNSLFLWSLSIGAVMVTVVIGYLVRSFITLQALYETGETISVLIAPFILMCLGLIAILLIGGFIKLLLYDFVVPIMYRDRIKTLDALRKFLPLFSSRFLYFLGFGLFMLVIVLVIIIGVVFVGLFTCCVGFLLLAIPYINAVILLPISYTIRAFSVEFLEQFGPEFHVFPRPESAPEKTETGIV